MYERSTGPVFISLRIYSEAERVLEVSVVVLGQLNCLFIHIRYVVNRKKVDWAFPIKSLKNKNEMNVIMVLIVEWIPTPAIRTEIKQLQLAAVNDTW